ncbi:glycoside hydrolase [Streptomyces sp. NPDC001941]|uniref:glycoside hydrolase n=1 Tax=Streptomyces sp. NPDC001941 TaxID=3154659 RepID=UPI0033224B0F
MADPTPAERRHATTGPSPSPRASGRPLGRRALASSAALAAALATTAGTAPAQAAAPGGDTAPTVRGAAVELSAGGTRFTVDTRTLGVTARSGAAQVPVSGAAGSELGTPGRVEVRGREAVWSYPAAGLTVTASSASGRVSVTVRASRDTSLDWPATGPGRGPASLEVPRGEGLSVPADDPFWNSPGAGLAGTAADLETGGLTLPVWGWTTQGRSVSYLVPESVGTSLAFASRGGRLNATARHAFSASEDTREYQVLFSVAQASPVATGADYRRYLDQKGGVRTLREKIARNPDTARLLGAEHAYLWGDALKAESVRTLRAQGNGRLWLGYDANDNPMDREAVRAAREAGYLAGPYDSYDNGQPADGADTPVAKWPDKVYPDFCVKEADGSDKTGFGGRGCYLSTEAFRKAEPEKHYLADRQREMTANGVNSYFLDVDAAGELFTDHSPVHPQNKKRDRANRLARMEALAAAGRPVLGSESAVGWSAGAPAFTHGALTPVNDGLWAFQKDKEKWGAYWPAEAPAFFFKPTTLPKDLATSMYDPRYRVPIYQTALHDVLVSTDRWEIPYDKLPDQKRDRALMSLLYNTPLNFTLSGANLESAGKEMAGLQKDFGPLHLAAGTEPMSAFRQLTADRTVQRSVFGDGVLTVTANFGTKAYQGLPAGCADAKLKGEEKARRICPVK